MKKALRILQYVLVGALFIFTVWQRFAYPEFTETQLFLNYWKVYIGMLLFICGTAFYVWGGKE